MLSLLEQDNQHVWDTPKCILNPKSFPRPAFIKRQVRLQKDQLRSPDLRTYPARTILERELDDKMFAQTDN